VILPTAQYAQFHGIKPAFENVEGNLLLVLMLKITVGVKNCSSSNAIARMCTKHEKKVFCAYFFKSTSEKGGKASCHSI
jgi:hypothetical protein